MNKDILKQRILNGVKYFENISPSQWNHAHTLHVKKLHELIKQYLDDKSVAPDLVETAKEIFKLNNGDIYK